MISEHQFGARPNGLTAEDISFFHHQNSPSALKKAARDIQAAEAALGVYQATSAAAASSEIRQRRVQEQQLVPFNPLFAQLQSQRALLQQLDLSERNLTSSTEEDTSCCNCFSTPPSHGWRINTTNGQAEAYSEPGGCFAKTASYKPGVAGRILTVLGNDHQCLKNYPLTLRYLLEQEARVSKSDKNAVERLFTLFVEKTAAEQRPSSGGLQLDTYLQLWPSYQVISSVLGYKRISEIVRQIEAEQKSS